MFWKNPEFVISQREKEREEEKEREFQFSAGQKLGAEMGDSTEELEPLFDYRRVQPVNFISLEDDDSDSSPCVSSKRRKISKSANNNKEDKNNKDAKSVVVLDGEDEEDWLPPPPKNPMPVSNAEDSAIRELRLKKQELASLAKSAEDALRAVDEAARKALASFSDMSPSEDTEEPPKPPCNRAKIVISIQDKAGSKQCRVFADESFEQLFIKYAEKANIDIKNLVFCFDGDKIDPASTPQDLEMEDNDIIEVHVKAR